MKRFCAELLLVLSLSTILVAQKPASVLVSVTNKDGYPPEVELRDRLEVTADKQLAKIVSVDSASELPVHIAVMIDKSGQLSQLVNQEQMDSTAFLGRFVRQGADRPFMLDLAKGAPNLTAVRNYADFRAAVSRRRNLSGDSVLNALKSYVETVSKMYGDKFPSRRAVILFSNGGAQIGQDLLPKIREYVIANHITMFIVNTDWTWRYFGLNSAGLLQELAEDTGGTFEDPTTSNSRTVNLQELPDILNHMGAVIRNQYQVKFETAKFDDKMHSLNLRALDTSLVLHAPRYFEEGR